LAAAIQRAVALAWGRGSRVLDTTRREGLGTLDGTGYVVDQTFAARRLHIVRRESLGRVARASGPSGSA
jgi:hypothetical protein